MESRWLSFDRLVRDLDALKALHDRPGRAEAPLLAEARLATQEAAAAVQRAASYTAADFDEHLLAQAAAAVARAQRVTVEAWSPLSPRPSARGRSHSAL